MGTTTPIPTDVPVAAVASTGTGEFVSAAALTFLLALGAFLGGLWLVRSGFDTWRISRLVCNTATERPSSVALGRTELRGRAEPLGEPLEKPFTDGECVYASWSIEEYRGGDDPRWKYELSDNKSGRFLLADDRGGVVVEDLHYEDPSFPINDDALPTGALTTDVGGRDFGRVEFDDECEFETEVDAGEEPPEPIADWCEAHDLDPVCEHPRRYRQAAIPPGEEVYVFGQATRREDLDAPADVDDVLVERDDETGLFVLSNLDEQNLAAQYVNRSRLTVVAGLVLSVGGLVALLFQLGIA